MRRATRSRASSLPRADMALARSRRAALRRRAAPLSKLVEQRPPAGGVRRPARSGRRERSSTLSSRSPSPARTSVYAEARPTSLTSLYVHIAIANLLPIAITLPRGSVLFDTVRNRSRGVDFGVVDVPHAVLVDPDDVDEFVAEAHVLRGEDVARVDGLARGLVEADDADDEIDLARGKLLRAPCRRAGCPRRSDGTASSSARRVGFSDFDEPHRLEADEPPAFQRNARPDHPQSWRWPR